MKAVLVTGAGAGIGRATVELLAGRGYHVFAGARAPAHLAALASLGPRVTALPLDVSDAASRAAAVEQVRATLDGAPLVAVVNNAGIAVQGPLETLPLAALSHQMEVNLLGVAGVVQVTLPLLRAARARGERVTLVQVGSIGGRIATPFNGAYNASKFALAGYCGALRQELRPWGIRVSLVEPGSTRTGIWAKVERSVADAEGRGDGLYDPLLARYRAAIERLQRGGMPPARVAAVIARQIAARWPAHRRLVGDAWGMALLGFLPSSWRDALTASLLGLPGRGALRAAATPAREVRS